MTLATVGQCFTVCTAALIAGCDGSAHAAETQIVRTVSGLNFSPYRDGQSPPQRVPVEQLRERLALIQNDTSNIRTFGADSNLELIPAEAKKLGLGVVMGAFINSDEANNARQVKNLITAAAEGHVDVAVVGNEPIRSGQRTPAQMASLLTETRGRLDALGLADVPLGTAEPFEVLFERNANGSLAARHPELIEASDVVLMQAYPFWQGVPIDRAADTLATWYGEALSVVQSITPGMEIIIAETGWPTAGATIGGAVPSPENAVQYYTETATWAENNDVDLFYFSAFDENWKQEPLGIEVHWGIRGADGQLKPAFVLPEPSTMMLLAGGVLVGGLGRKR